MDNNINGQYDIITRLLHWVIALLLIGLLSLGWYMTNIQAQPNSGWYFDLHKSLGLIAATLIILRILWRLAHKPMPLPSTIPYWQVILSRSVHLLLYFCMIIMPLTGFIGASLSQYGVAFFGTQLPTWLNPNHEISNQLFEIHGVVAGILVGLIALHLLAAIKHLFINKDNVFQRMWL